MTIKNAYHSAELKRTTDAIIECTARRNKAILPTMRVRRET